MMQAAPTFTTRHVVVGGVAALVIQTALVLLFLAGATHTKIKAIDEARVKEAPIAVKPVLDELPLLKLGSKKDKLKPKLPDMWKKQAPVPVKRYEEVSAPSEKAEDTPEAIPSAPVKENKEAPPENAEIVKEVEQQLEDPPPDQPPPPELSEEGAADGSKDGTETDPMKARAVDLYKAKIAAWFSARFRQPELPCEVRKPLSVSLSVQVGADRTITGYSVRSASGNDVFDAKAKSTVDALIGEELPPPPPLYPDILGSTVYPRLTGAQGCD